MCIQVWISLARTKVVFICFQFCYSLKYEQGEKRDILQKKTSYQVRQRRVPPTYILGQVQYIRNQYLLCWMESCIVFLLPFCIT